MHLKIRIFYYETKLQQTKKSSQFLYDNDLISEAKIGQLCRKIMIIDKTTALDFSDRPVNKVTTFLSE